MNATDLDELFQTEVALLASQGQTVTLNGSGWAALILRALDRAELQPAVRAAVLGAANFELEEIINPEAGEATSPAEGRP